MQRVWSNKPLFFVLYGERPTGIGAFGGKWVYHAVILPEEKKYLYDEIRGYPYTTFINTNYIIQDDANNDSVYLYNGKIFKEGDVGEPSLSEEAQNVIKELYRPSSILNEDVLRVLQLSETIGWPLKLGYFSE